MGSNSGEGSRKVMSPVGVVCSTIAVCKNDVVAFMGSDGRMYWVDMRARKDLSSFEFGEGKMFWVYYAVKGGKVISLLPYSGEDIESLPKIDPVEV